MRNLLRPGSVPGLCLLVGTIANAQSVLTGRVSDAESGRPLVSREEEEQLLESHAAFFNYMENGFGA